MRTIEVETRTVTTHTVEIPDYTKSVERFRQYISESNDAIKDVKRTVKVESDNIENQIGTYIAEVVKPLFEIPTFWMHKDIWSYLERQKDWDKIRVGFKSSWIGDEIHYELLIYKDGHFEWVNKSGIVTLAEHWQEFKKDLSDRIVKYFDDQKKSNNKYLDEEINKEKVLNNFQL